MFVLSIKVAIRKTLETYLMILLFKIIIILENVPKIIIIFRGVYKIIIIMQDTAGEAEMNS